MLDDLDDRPETVSRIVVVDAVDEARDPRLLTDLLVRLARRPGLRVVIGARSHVLPPAANASLLVDLDSDHYRDPGALAAYIHQLLIAAHEPDVASPYEGRGDDTAATIAAAIATKATARPTAKGQAESFLLAQLLARAVRSRQQAIDVTRARWADQLPADVGAAFDEDLRRLGRREPIARALLAALAWAKGPGLPWERIWAPIAQALAAHTGLGIPPLDDDHVRWLFGAAGAYIAEDVGPGKRSVFRPFHDLLAAHLRGQPSDDQLDADPAVGEAWQQRRQQVEQAITRALLASLPTYSDGGVDWELAHPYLRTYLAQHAYAAGPDAFAPLAVDLDYLAVAVPAVLTTLLGPPKRAPRRSFVIRVYQRAAPLLGRSARDNAAYLQEAFVAETGWHPTGQRIRPTYRTLTALIHLPISQLIAPDPGLQAAMTYNDRPTILSTTRSHRLLMARIRRDIARNPGDLLNAVAFGVDAGGRPLLASAGDDGVVRLWDPATGTPVGKPLAGQTGAVFAVAFGAGAGGRPLLASAGFDRVRLWDPTTGIVVGKPLGSGHTGPEYAVAFGAGDGGRPLLASAGFDRAVRLWDPATGTPVGKPLAGHTGAVFAVAFGADAGGRPLLASASHRDGAVRLWDPATGTPVVTLLRRDIPVALATQNTQLAIADAERITVIEVTDRAG